LVDRRRAIYNPRNDPEVGKKAPVLALWDANGQKVKLHSFQGRRIAVIFTDTCAN
jgi:peroxiredoxin